MKTTLKRSCIATLALAALAGSANADLVIHEPFADNDSTLTGNTPGTGLTGTWQTSGTTWDVTSPGMTFGSLATSGNKAVNVNTPETTVRGAHGISVGSTLSDAGLLNDGATLWFSFLWKMDDATVSNGDAGFALGTDILSGGNNNNIPMTNSGSGIGVAMRTTNGTVGAASWSGGSRALGGTSAWPDRSAPVLIVGEIIWGADALANDTINIYTPGTDLALPALAVSSTTAVLDQSLFDTITFATKREGEPQIDEIRFGSTYASVTPMSAGGGSAYDTWAGGAVFTDDDNGDGVANGVAFLLGAADPDEIATDRLPTVTESGGGLIMTFNCLPVAARGTATLRVEHSSDLGITDAWVAAEVPDATGGPVSDVSFVVGAGPVGPPALNSVTATIDSAAAAGGKLFVRLSASQP